MMDNCYSSHNLPFHSSVACGWLAPPVRPALCWVWAPWWTPHSAGCCCSYLCLSLWDLFSSLILLVLCFSWQHVSILSDYLLTQHCQCTLPAIPVLLQTRSLCSLCNSPSAWIPQLLTQALVTCGWAPSNAQWLGCHLASCYQLWHVCWAKTSTERSDTLPLKGFTHVKLSKGDVLAPSSILKSWEQRGYYFEMRRTLAWHHH